MKFGVLQFFSWPQRRTTLQTVYQRAMQRIEIMDKSGYDAVWLAEHHFTEYSVCPSVHMMGMHLANKTKNLRIGTAVSLAAMYHPLRLAEEVALLDVLSEGRVNWGAGRGFDPTEFHTFNIPPPQSKARFQEAVDIVLEAWTNETITWKSENWNFENVEVLPKPFQQPHPPVWVTIGSAGTAIPVAEHNYVGAVFLAGYPGVRSIFDGYRQGYRTRHGADAPLDRLAYCALVYVADDEAEAKAGGNEVLWYMTSNKVATEYINPPGYHPPAVAAQIANGGNLARSLPSQTTLDAQMERGNVFCGTPDQVYEQIKTFYDYSGGFGNLLIMGQAGHLTFEQTRRSMSLFASEVYPRLKELTAGYDVDEMSATQARLPDQQGIDLGTFGLEFAR